MQLNLALLQADQQGGIVPLDKIKGISVAEIDWKPLVKDLSPATDPLAKLVPADQHLVLFPNLAALATVADRLAQQGTIILRLARRAPDAKWIARYEGQLGLSLADLAKFPPRGRRSQRGPDRIRSLL